MTFILYQIIQRDKKRHFFFIIVVLEICIVNRKKISLNSGSSSCTSNSLVLFASHRQTHNIMMITLTCMYAYGHDNGYIDISPQYAPRVTYLSIWFHLYSKTIIALKFNAWATRNNNHKKLVLKATRV